MSGILDTIDNAIADYELSADAMRWTPDPPPATGGLVASGPDIARFVDAAGLPGLPLDPWQRRLLDHALSHVAAPALDAHVASARLTTAFDRMRLGGRWGKPPRPERVSRIRRAYGAKQRPRQ